MKYLIIFISLSMIALAVYSSESASPNDKVCSKYVEHACSTPEGVIAVYSDVPSENPNDPMAIFNSKLEYQFSCDCQTGKEHKAAQ